MKRAIFWPTTSRNGNLWQLWILSQRDLNFCIHDVLLLARNSLGMQQILGNATNHDHLNTGICVTKQLHLIQWFVQSQEISITTQTTPYILDHFALRPQKRGGLLGTGTGGEGDIQSAICPIMHHH